MIRRLTIERTPCFGFCPVYSASVRETGEVEFHGQDYVAKKGHYTWSIDPKVLDKLFTYLQKKGYFELGDNYNRCDYTCNPSCITSIQLRDGTTKKIDHYHEDTTAPHILTTMENKIDSMLGLHEYIEQPHENRKTKKKP
jgi:hypothetical protein